MFDSSKQHHDEASPSERTASRVKSLLTTDDIVARVGYKARLPLARFVLWGALALGFLALVMVCAAIVLKERSAAVADAAQAAPAAVSPLLADARAPEPTVVRIRLSHKASVFVDGRYIGMQKRLRVRLSPGEHALLIRFAHKSYTHTVRIGRTPGSVHCAHAGGCGPFKPDGGL